MVSFSSLVLACSAAVGVFAAPRHGGLFQPASRDLLKRQSITSSTTGTNNGYYYQAYIESDTGCTYTNGAGGAYSVTWEASSTDIVVGKGWTTGSDRNITYTGNLTSSGFGTVSVYGWSTDPLVEYYIMDYYGSNGGAAGTQKGTVVADGSTYDIYENTRTNEPSIQGTATFNQYISVRQDKRVGGTITTATHFDAWSGLGLDLGTMNYQIVAVEGYDSSGSASITVSTAAS